MDLAAAAGRRRLRSLALWTALTALGAAVVVVVRSGALAPARPPRDFAELVLQLATAATAVAVAALWALGTQVALDVWRCPKGAAARPGADPVRRALLTACGVTVAATLVAQPAHAALPDRGEGPPLPLAGLPLPDRAPGDLPARTDGIRRVGVRPADSVWSIAERQLVASAPTAAVAAYWRRVLHLNRDVLGDDPDLVQPGLQLRLPPPPHHLEE